MKHAKKITAAMIKKALRMAEKAEPREPQNVFLICPCCGFLFDPFKSETKGVR